ncbi:MAG: chromosome segregation protein SMC [Pyrinomonadaceae bacterium]|nr:chromosome segregation protein SMC [Pyrinomonadaceae bacterium]
MFRLQRLEITGFKSFADHTDLIFTGEGITAIVGPNGCGKSNVSDAIAWVLGEQRVKNLRGGEMKDVIFTGSRNRPPSGMAEVVLHMVRDETVEEEPDIEDIDATLEEIDDHSVTFEDPLLVEAAEAGAPEAESLAATAESPEASGPDASTEAPQEAAATEASAADAQPSTELKITKPHGRRHWRPTRMALEFAPGETVTVTRRLYRSGESEYLLQGRTCRLRDIQDLFSGTGLSGAHYAIIEQGRIGQILSAKPMDRRTLIEEAAGITKFRVRQRAAEARLESARSNLNRVSDIISEIDRQVNSLRRQAAKARRYRILREELRELLRRVYVAEERALTALLDETRARVEEATREEQSLLSELAAREEQARSATQSARAVEEELAEKRAAAADAALQRDRRQRERIYQEEQVASLTRRREEIENEIEAVRARILAVEAEVEHLSEEDARLRTAAEESAAMLQSAEASYSRKLLEVAEAEAEIERGRAELLTHTAVAERLMEIGRQLESALERLTSQAEGLAREGERAAAIHAERIVEAESLNEEISRSRERLQKLVAEREEAVHAVVLGHEAVSETDAVLSGIRDEHSRTRHRLDSLLELDQRRAHYSLAVQRLFSAGEAVEDFHFMGTLADMLQVEPRWERAVEGAFGSSLQSIIVPTPDDAARAALWLRENDAGRASFLVAGLHGASDEAETDVLRKSFVENSNQEPAGGGRDEFENAPLEDVRIGDILGAPPELLRVLERTLPQRMNARLASSLEDAMAKSLVTNEMYVTREGDWVAGGQLVTAGDERALEEGAGLLGFKRELRELEGRGAELSLEMARAEELASETRARLVELEDAVVILNEAIGREERDAMARELNAASLAQEIERAERHMRVVADDAARLAEERLELEARRAAALSEAETAEGLRAAASVMVTEAATRLAAARREAEAESEMLGAERAGAAAAAERRRATASELRRMEAERADLGTRLERHGRETMETGARLEELHRSIEEIEASESTISEECEREEREIAQAAARLEEARARADALALELSELNQRAAQSREARAQLEVQRAEATARLGYVREACHSELNQSLEELAREMPVEEEFDLDAGRARVEELRARVEGFGAVNMMALEELSESEERLLFLTGQRQDIIEGIASTEEALREIKRRSRERFRHAFEEINRNFGELFQELFGGGRGEMSLIDADDVLESGIDIIAQPPGKRLQNVLLLSGGEKAMAALSLVLAIFRYRPSPFCLLDEVDAPLDEANVGRFTAKIGQMAAETQFIVITHNKRTMEMARALYGVTMEEVGVSKLVSVKFE